MGHVKLYLILIFLSLKSGFGELGSKQFVKYVLGIKELCGGGVKTEVEYGKKWKY